MRQLLATTNLLSLLALASCEAGAGGPVTDENGCELPPNELYDEAYILFVDALTGYELIGGPLGSVLGRWDPDSIRVRESTGLEVDYEVAGALYFSISRPLKDSTPFFSRERRTFYIDLPGGDTDTLVVEYSIAPHPVCGTTGYSYLVASYNGQTAPTYLPHPPDFIIHKP